MIQVACGIILVITGFAVIFLETSKNFGNGISTETVNRVIDNGHKLATESFKNGVYKGMVAAQENANKGYPKTLESVSDDVISKFKSETSWWNDQ